MTKAANAFACFWGALLLLSVPLYWLAAGICAAVFHELCHLLMIHKLGGKVLGVSIGINGTVIDAAFSGKKEELISTLAGPAGSFLLLFLIQKYPRLAVCGCIHGMYNLLPIYPLDGGRILACCLELWHRGNALRLLYKVEIYACIFIFILTIIGTMLFSTGLLPVFWVLLLIFKIISRKRPCKPE